MEDCKKIVTPRVELIIQLLVLVKVKDFNECNVGEPQKALLFLLSYLYNHK